MAVSHEIKSQLAKLLATEDLVVEHKNVHTACFNVHTRVLTLPMWEKASNAIYDLLVGHEVGHALFTPDIDWSEDRKIPPSFVNIVEDVRVEKLMKRKYGGLLKTFYKGYCELSNQDFFDIENEDVDTMNLVDRINLYFKIGNFVDISFNNFDEREIVKLVADTETFDQVLDVSEKIYKYCKSQQNQQEMQPESPLQDGSSVDNDGRECFSDSDSEEDGQLDTTSDFVDLNEDKEPPDPADLDTPSYNSDENNEPKSQTDSALEQNLQDLVDDNPYNENTYVEIPNLNLDNIIIDYDKYHSYVESYWVEQNNISIERSNKYDIPYENVFQNADLAFRTFKKSGQKEVNYLVKEFECKKAADSYARATTARTGVLDCSKLHTYKYNEDLFSKVTTLADGKNHGLIFILDWSGSMGNVLLDTFKQLMNLVWFCKKVNIPFEVYAFTNNWAHVTYTETNKPVFPEYSYEPREDIFKIAKDFNLMNILSSKIKNSKFESCVLNIWRIAYQYTYCSNYSVPPQVSLSGTPLNEAIVCLHQIIPNFQKENKLQKVQCVILTDGEASQLHRHVKINYRNNIEGYIGCRSVIPGSTFLRDRKLGRTYSFGYGYHEFTSVLLNNLRDRFSNTNFIGIRILAPREASKFMKMYLTNDEYQKAEYVWKKNRSFSMKNVGYTTYFGMSANALSQNTEFDVNTTATKSQIKSAFIKSLKSKKMNKQILSEFMSLVA
jgi:hypothetical protein